MFTGMDSLLAQERREELVREIASERLDRKPGAGRRPGRRLALWLVSEIEVPTGMPPSRKIRLLRDAGSPTRT